MGWLSSLFAGKKRIQQSVTQAQVVYLYENMTRDGFTYEDQEFILDIHLRNYASYSGKEIKQINTLVSRIVNQSRDIV